jgi:hypothetical protein
MVEYSDDTPSRYEMNRLVRNIMTRHGIDLELISISCSASFVYLQGFLTRFRKPDLKTVDVDVIFQEIEKIPFVRGIIADLENWTINITRSDGTWIVIPRVHADRPALSSSEPEEHRIEDVERIADVLEEIKKKERSD